MTALVLTYLALVLSVLALVAAIMALLRAGRAKMMATPTPEMKRLAQRLAEPEGEQLLAQLVSQAQSQEGRLRQLESLTDTLGRQLRGAVQKVGLQRFNAEEGLGGNLSFALVLLDSRNHGLMLTSIYSLHSCRVFVRGIVSGKTDHPLMPEEEEALRQALQG